MPGGEREALDARVRPVDEVVHGERIRHADAARAVDRVQHGPDDDVGVQHGEVEGGVVVCYVLPRGLLSEFLRRAVASGDVVVLGRVFCGNLLDASAWDGKEVGCLRTSFQSASVYGLRALLMDWKELATLTVLPVSTKRLRLVPPDLWAASRRAVVLDWLSASVLSFKKKTRNTCPRIAGSII